MEAKGERKMATEINSTIEMRAIRWLCGDDTGLSSKAILNHMMGARDADQSYPLDPSDLGRCLRMLRLFPEFKGRMVEMARYGPAWESLSKKWQELELLMINEVGIDWSKGRSARRTFEAIRRAIADGHRGGNR